MNKNVCMGLLVAASSVYLVRRLSARWGATEHEAHQPLPGDEIVPHPMVETTHAITIRAKPHEVWPWLVQMGYRRGGWYTGGWYRLIDRYIWHTEFPITGQVIPELQAIHPGDIIPDGPPGTAYFTVAALERDRLLALHSTTHIRFMVPQAIRDNPWVGVDGEFSWVFVLHESVPGTSRLILRTRAVYGPAWFRALTISLLIPADAIMASLMLGTLKRRAEQSGAMKPDMIQDASTPADSRAWSR